MNPTMSSDQKTTQLRIQRALGKPGATGKRGFLLWVQAAFPPAVAAPILKAAARHVDTPVTPKAGIAGFGDVSSSPTLATLTLDDITPSAGPDPTVPPVSAVTAGTSSTAADPGWLADITGAIKSAASIFQLKAQTDAAKQLFNVNLQRAQQGLPPIASDPTAYGLPAPTANIGLTSGTRNTLFVVAGVTLAAVVLSGAMKRRGRK